MPLQYDGRIKASGRTNTARLLRSSIKSNTSKGRARPCVSHFTVFFTAKIKAETDSKNMHKALDCLERTLPLPATTPLPAEG
jgi:hypothetical protein